MKGKVRVSGCLSVLGKLRVVDKQQVREGQWVESSLRGMQLRSGVGCKPWLLANALSSAASLGDLGGWVGG